MNSNPSYPQAFKVRAASLLKIGHPAEALKLLEALCQQQVADPEAWYLLGTACGMLGQHQRGAECCQRALALRPRYPEAHNSLGNALAALGRLPEAETAYRAALMLNGRYADAHQNLAQVLHHQGRMAEAETQYRRFLRLTPDSAPVQYRLGLSLMAQNRPAEAETAFRAALRLNPDFVEAHNNLGTALRALNRLAEAEAAYRAALRLRPEYVEALVNLGVVLHSQDKVEEAIASLVQALQINPHSAEAHNNLGNVYALAGRLTEAIASYREALRLKPRSADTFNNLFNTHLRRGELEEALACHREAVRLDPERATATYSGYLLNLNYHPDLTPQAIFEEHRHWGKVYAPRPELPAAYINSREPGRRLRIGYVSADFRLHSVAFFMEPVLAHHDHTRFEIYCYAQVAAPDSVTERLKQLATTWRSIVGLDDEQAAALIRSDEIDILVDLGGHTAGNRLGVFARRPAPVQTSYIGYPNTTGLPAMDYRIVNPWTVPAGFEAYFTEKLAYVPSPPCFRPPADCPPVNAPPALTSGQVTFGSFNNLIKLASPVIALWAAVLQAVPDSRLMLKSKALADAEIRDLYHARFAAHGIGPDRLLLCGADPLQEYLRAFNDIDIALDPFPYNGGTTTYHASWMGVPVVTLLGQNMVSRMGYAILANLGLEELVAKTPAEYVTIAANLATDPGRLSALRASLRERMRGSSLTDGRLAASALETLYRDIWRSWCLDTNTAPSLDKE